jgi:hypothetical protein
VFGCGREEELISDGVGEGDDLNAVGFTEIFLCYRASRDSSCGLLVTVLSPHVQPLLTNGLSCATTSTT